MLMSKFSSIMRIMFLTILTTFSLAIAEAKATGTIQGKVVDPLGAVVPGADVVLLQNGKAVSSTKTDQEGNFAFTPVEVGQYLVRVTAPGFATQDSPAVNLGEARMVTLEVALQVGALRQQIVVSETGTSLPESQVGASVTVLDQSQGCLQ